MYGISPSMFVLAWMAIISCVIAPPVQGLRLWEALTVFMSVLSSLLCLLLEVGALDSKDGKTSEDGGTVRAFRIVALVCFLARILASVVTVASS